jgi:acetyl esterase/lipase
MHSRKGCFVAVTGLCSLLMVCGPLWGTERANEAGLEIREDVEYGNAGGVSLKLDLARPESRDGKLPALVLIHGGGWQAGNKRMLRPIMTDFARAGYIAMTVGYRLAPKYRTPAQIEDCKCAVRWIRAHADELGVDGRRLGAMGMSAGAHLSMLLGVMDSADALEGTGGWADQSSKVQCVVSYFGPVDLTRHDLNGSPAQGMVNEDVVRMILTNFVGGRPEDHGDALRQVSPVAYVSQGDAPMLLFQGTKDNLVPYDQAFEMATALTKAGIPGRIEFILGAGHGWGGDELKRTQHAALAFFDQHLKNHRDSK